MATNNERVLARSTGIDDAATQQAVRALARALNEALQRITTIEARLKAASIP